MTDSLVVAPARPHQVEAAFHLMFRRAPADAVEARVANALHLVESGELRREGVFVATAGDRVLGALVCLPIPGASGLVWPPRTEDVPGAAAVEDALVGRAAGWLRGCGAKLGQSLLAPDDAVLATPLERNGFRHITSLWYMQHDLTHPVRAPAGRLTWERYDRLPAPSLFGETLRRTYEGSRDCPEVNGARTIDEVMEGHRAQGKHDPALWRLARHRGEVVGVLLMVEEPEWASLDVSYVGVVPAARRRGFGREMMGEAFRLTEAAGVARMTLSVDARNQPAWDLYTSLGFEAHERREVFLAVWGS